MRLFPISSKSSMSPSFMNGHLDSRPAWSLRSVSLVSKWTCLNMPRLGVPPCQFYPTTHRCCCFRFYWPWLTDVDMHVIGVNFLVWQFCPSKSLWKHKIEERQMSLLLPAPRASPAAERPRREALESISSGILRTCFNSKSSNSVDF